MSIVDGTKNSSDASVRGIITGDCECWCLEVTESEYRMVKGEKAWKDEWDHVESCAQDHDKYDPKVAKRIREAGPIWRIYPNDLISEKFHGKYCRIKVRVEFVKDTKTNSVLNNITDTEDIP